MVISINTLKISAFILLVVMCYITEHFENVWVKMIISLFTWVYTVATIATCIVFLIAAKPIETIIYKGEITKITAYKADDLVRKCEYNSLLLETQDDKIFTFIPNQSVTNDTYIFEGDKTNTDLSSAFNAIDKLNTRALANVEIVTDESNSLYFTNISKELKIGPLKIVSGDIAVIHGYLPKDNFEIRLTQEIQDKYLKDAAKVVELL